MCLIITRYKKEKLNFKDMKQAYNRNSDGFGIMYASKGEMINERILPRSFDDVLSLYKEHAKRTDVLTMHFRFKTAGKISVDNCHPFKINDNFSFVHNGPRLPIPILNEKYSDTFWFNETYLKPLFRNYPTIILSKKFRSELSEFIGNDKIVICDIKNKHYIINKHHGNFRNGNWFSNSYWQSLPKPKIKTYNYNNFDYYDDEWWDQQVEEINFSKKNSW